MKIRKSSRSTYPGISFKDKKIFTPPPIFFPIPPNIQDNQVRYSKEMIDITGSVIENPESKDGGVNGIKPPLRKKRTSLSSFPEHGDNFVSIEVTGW